MSLENLRGKEKEGGKGERGKRRKEKGEREKGRKGEREKGGKGKGRKGERGKGGGEGKGKREGKGDEDLNGSIITTREKVLAIVGKKGSENWPFVPLFCFVLLIKSNGVKGGNRDEP